MNFAVSQFLTICISYNHIINSPVIVAHIDRDKRICTGNIEFTVIHEASFRIEDRNLTGCACTAIIEIRYSESSVIW